jgi:glycosyltransferase involved in cell wall biosynthesis
VRPLLSVLVPTRGRPDLAGACVRALLQETHPSFEVVLCDQSPDGTTARAVEAADDGTGRLRRITVGGVGRSRALNAGLPHARGRWIVFTDDDCTPEPGWLGEVEAACAAAPPRAAVLGPVRPGPVGPGMAIPPATLEDPGPAVHAGRIDRDVIYPNVAIPRQAFAVLGGFDERMSVGTPLPGGEDNDFGYRLLRAGWTIRYRPGTGVVHHAWRTPQARSRLKRDYGVGQGAFYAKHLARADAWIAWRLLLDVVRTARAVGGSLLRGRGGEAADHARFLYGILLGLAGMTRLLLRRVPSGEEAVAAAMREDPA